MAAKNLANHDDGRVIAAKQPDSLTVSAAHGKIENHTRGDIQVNAVRSCCRLGDTPSAVPSLPTEAFQRMKHPKP